MPMDNVKAEMLSGKHPLMEARRAAIEVRLFMS